MAAGHVEKTNDRDYEVEERYAFMFSLKGNDTLGAAVAKFPRFYTGGTAPWSLRQPDCKRKQRDIWIRYEVDNLVFRGSTW